MVTWLRTGGIACSCVGFLAVALGHFMLNFVLGNVSVRSASVSVGVIVASVLLAVMARTAVKRHRLLYSLRKCNGLLQRERDLVVAEACSRERSRIARELRDSLGHHLVLISMYAAQLDSRPDMSGLRTAAALRSTSASAMLQLRTILGVLQPGSTDDRSTDLQPDNLLPDNLDMLHRI
ncbi:histidine kinase [Actinoplanes sp. TFC3]|uniref:histidine kinase n=1 Tax=Actinoplanes sp. TFC3 TaxID=1710355 RepID=UPI001290236B|nr:histidine kinase dimerization/phosphoacceptor domain-containing protein [Actinoplanes sp. TFC3]